MKRKMLRATMYTMALASLTVNAAEESLLNKHRSEVIGFGAGATVGAIVGNVPGAIVGGFAGAALSSKNAADNKEQAYQYEHKNHDTKMLSQGMTVDINFRTAEAKISARDKTRLEEIAKFLQQFQDVSIHLDGYADPRGKDAFNMQLSQNRADAIRTFLIENGIDADKIHVKAHGKEESTAKDIDGYAFERRVSISLQPN